MNLKGACRVDILDMFGYLGKGWRPASPLQAHPKCDYHGKKYHFYRQMARI